MININKKSLWLAFIIIALIFIVFPLLTKGGGILPKEITSNEVKCNVDITNPAFSSVKINSADCGVVRQCLKPFYLVNSLSFFGLVDEGIVKLETRDNYVSKKYDIGEGGKRTYELKLCTNVNDGMIKTIDDDGSLTDSRSVSW